MTSSKTYFNLRRIEMGDEESASSEEEALSDVDDSNIPNKKVIILGAGVAGISAALFLKKHNVDAVVLEGRDRIGGRIYTDYHSFSAPVDLGAFIITGADPDPSRNSACDPCGPISRHFGLGLHYLDSRTLPIYHEVYKQTPIPHDIDRKSALLFDHILDGIADMQSDSEDMVIAANDARSLGELFTQCVEEYVEKIEMSKEQSSQMDTPRILGSTINASDLALVEEIQGVKSPTPSSLKQKRSTGVDDDPDPPAKQERDPSPIRKKLKITCRGQKDVVLDVYTKSKTPSESAAHSIQCVKTMSLARLCPAEKMKKMQEVKEPEQIKDSKPMHQKTDRAKATDVHKESPKMSTVRRGRGRPPKNPLVQPKIDFGNGHEANKSHHLTPADPAAKVDVVMWHKAHLEYGCGTSLSNLSSVHWNQDEDYGGFNGRHAIVKGGLAPLLERLSIGLDIRLEMVVKNVAYGSDGVRVTCQNGDVFEGGCVICTLPLGVLKSTTVTFTPPLPAWKESAIKSIGFGNLNKVVLEFQSVFWDASIDYFGIVPKPSRPSEKIHTSEPTSNHSFFSSNTPGATTVESQYETAGFCFMWCTAYRYTGKPLLTGIVSGNMADKVEEMSEDHVIRMALSNLSSVFGDCVASLFLRGKMTRWKSDVFSRGCYTYVPVGMCGKGYENLGHPILGHGFGVLFGGEHTNKQHPDTIGGAMITGVREGKRALHLLYGPDAAKRKVQVPSVQRARDQDASELLFKEAEAEIVRLHRN